nr:hypothetical protein [Tanacetum cinerariifolium]
MNSSISGHFALHVNVIKKDGLLCTRKIASTSSRDERRTTQNSGICSPGPNGEMYYEDESDVIHVENSSDLALSTSLNDLEITALHIDGQSINVDAPPDIIDVVDKDDDIIDEEDPIPHDLADSDDEDLVNLDIDDGVNMSADVARGHGGDGGGDDRPPLYQGVALALPFLAPNATGAEGKEDGSYDLEGIRRGRPSHISEADWDAHLAFWNDPKKLARAAQNKQNRAKSKVMGTSATREYPSLMPCVGCLISIFRPLGDVALDKATYSRPCAKTGNCFLLNINGNCKSRLINGMRGRKTFFDIRVPVMMRASMTLLRSCVIISRVLLQRPPDILRLQRIIIGAPTISSSMCGGKLAKFNEFKYPGGYKSSVSPPSFPCALLHPNLVLPDGNNNAAIPEAATVRTNFSSDRRAAVIAFHRKVFPVPPWPYTNMSLCVLLAEGAFGNGLVMLAITRPFCVACKCNKKGWTSMYSANSERIKREIEETCRMDVTCLPVEESVNVLL